MNTEDMNAVAHELRTKIKSKISHWAGVEVPTAEQEHTVIIIFCFMKLSVLTLNGWVQMFILF